MRKPHEETWHADDDGNVYVGTGDDRMTFLEAVSGDTPARAQLAAQAPPMARILESLVRDASGILSLSEAIGSPALEEMRTALRAAGVLP